MKFSYEKMPALRPIAIPTKGKGLIMALWTWIWCVRTWEVVEDWTFAIDDVEYVIRKGFVFDGASIPKYFWAYLSPIGVLLIPGLVHDWAYKYASLEKVTKVTKRKIHTETLEVDQKSADVLFHQVAVAVNGLWFANIVAYYALRLFGWFAWKKHRKNDT